MTPTPQVPEPYTPKQAAHRLYAVCDELEQRQVAPEVVATLRELSERFRDYLKQLPVVWERVEELARSNRL